MHPEGKAVIQQRTQTRKKEEPGNKSCHSKPFSLSRLALQEAAEFGHPQAKASVTPPDNSPSTLKSSNLDTNHYQHQRWKSSQKLKARGERHKVGLKQPLESLTCPVPSVSSRSQPGRPTTHYTAHSPTPGPSSSPMSSRSQAHHPSCIAQKPVSLPTPALGGPRALS